MDASLEANIIRMVFNAGPMVQFVLLILLFFSVTTWAIIVMKYRLFRHAKKESKNFLEIFWKSRNLSSAFKESKFLRYSPLAEMLRVSYIELNRVDGASVKLKDGNTAQGITVSNPQLGNIDNISRTLGRSINAQVTRLGRNLSFLATTGNTAPFVGLFGTVWGIMNAFREIGLRGSANLAIVAPGIAEALVATAAGLAAAIPAVMAYNYYTNQLRILEAEMRNFSSDLINIINRDLLIRVPIGNVTDG